MRPAEYPQKSCREGLMSVSGMGYNCELPLMHTGPCASQSSVLHRQQRARWERDNPEQVGQSVEGDDIVLPINYT